MDCSVKTLQKIILFSLAQREVILLNKPENPFQSKESLEN